MTSPIQNEPSQKQQDAIPSSSETEKQPTDLEQANQESDRDKEEAQSVKSNAALPNQLQNPRGIGRKIVQSNQIINVNTSKAQKAALQAVTSAIKAGREAKQ